MYEINRPKQDPFLLCSCMPDRKGNLGITCIVRGRRMGQALKERTYLSQKDLIPFMTIRVQRVVWKR